MDISDTCGFDDQLEIDGVWSDLPDGGSIKVARFGNEAHQQMMVDLRTKHLKEIEADTPEAKKLNRDLLIQTMAETLLLDWKGMSYNKTPLPYTKENAIKALQHRKFHEIVLAKAFDNEAYRAKVLEEDTKNSEPLSNGT